MPSITALGLASSLGGAVHAAAAFRAGLGCGRRLEDRSRSDDGEMDVVGHQAHPPADGYAGVGAWLRLMQLAWEDLHEGWAGERSWWPDTALVLVLPIIDPRRFPDLMGDAARWDHRLVAPLCSRLGLALPAIRLVLAQGHAGCAAALAAARDACIGGRCRRVLILAVDSLVDRPSIAWLADQGRLLAPDQPHGLLPGEAAVAMLLGSAPGAVEVLDAVALPAPVAEAGCVRAAPHALAQQGIAACERITSAPGTVDHYVDLTGEPWRARVWGGLQPHLRCRSLSPGRTWHPATGFGDTGAASGALACLLAVRAWARDHAGAGQALIWSLAEDGRTGLIRLGRADGRNGP